MTLGKKLRSKSVQMRGLWPGHPEMGALPQDEEGTETEAAVERRHTKPSEEGCSAGRVGRHLGGIGEVQKLNRMQAVQCLVWERSSRSHARRAWLVVESSRFVLWRTLRNHEQPPLVALVAARVVCFHPSSACWLCCYYSYCCCCYCQLLPAVHPLLGSHWALPRHPFHPCHLEYAEMMSKAGPVMRWQLPAQQHRSQTKLKATQACLAKQLPVRSKEKLLYSVLCGAFVVDFVLGSLG